MYIVYFHVKVTGPFHIMFRNWCGIFYRRNFLRKRGSPAFCNLYEVEKDLETIEQ